MRRCAPTMAGLLCAASLLAPSRLHAAADVLFPQPLHLVRVIDDSLSGETVRIDEYCAGNRIVSVRGAKVVVTDFAKQEILEIDRNAGTFSTTTFDEVAKANPAISASISEKTSWSHQAGGRKASASGRSLELAFGAQKDRKVALGLDPSVRLSRSAIEAILGSSYPNRRAPEHDFILEGASGNSRNRIQGASESSASHSLPAEIEITYEVEGEVVTTRSRVTSVDGELPSPDLMRIDPRWQRIESSRIRAARELEELDHLPTAKRQN